MGERRRKEEGRISGSKFMFINHFFMVWHGIVKYGNPTQLWSKSSPRISMKEMHVHAFNFVSLWCNTKREGNMHFS